MFAAMGDRIGIGREEFAERHVQRHLAVTLSSASVMRTPQRPAMVMSNAIWRRRGWVGLGQLEPGHHKPPG